MNTPKPPIAERNRALAPIILFVYNRPEHTRKTVEALVQNELAADSMLYIFADGPKQGASDEQLQRIQEVRDYIHQITGFQKVIIQESPANKGLANSVIAGVTQVINHYGRAIVLEDDIVTHRFFLRFMNEALERYQEDKRIYTIGGFTYDFSALNSCSQDVYLAHRSCSWGWATWLDRWETADWTIRNYPQFRQSKHSKRRFNRGGMDMADMLSLQMYGRIDSWAIRWDYALSQHNAYCLRPTRSLVTNIGMDGSGRHCTMDHHTVRLYDCPTYTFQLPRHPRPKRSIQHGFRDQYGKEPHPVLHLIYKLLPHSFWEYGKKLLCR